jgi:hypothetical protein
VPQRTLNIDSPLIEDYLHTDDILVDQSQPQPVAVFLNSEQETEALVINKEGELCHVYREPLSDSGWNIYGLGASLSTIAVVNSGTFWAIGASDGSLWQNNIGRWMQAPGLPGGAIAASVSAGPDGNVSVVEPVSIWVAGTQYNLDSGAGLSLTSNFMGQIAVSSLALGLHTAQLTSVELHLINRIPYIRLSWHRTRSQV